MERCELRGQNNLKLSVPPHIPIMHRAFLPKKNASSRALPKPTVGLGLDGDTYHGGNNKGGPFTQASEMQ